MTKYEFSTLIVLTTCAVKFWLEPLAPCETKQLEYSSCWKVDRASAGKPKSTEARGRRIRDHASSRYRNIFNFWPRPRPQKMLRVFQNWTERSPDLSSRFQESRQETHLSNWRWQFARSHSSLLGSPCPILLYTSNLWSSYQSYKSSGALAINDEQVTGSLNFDK